MNPKFRHGIAVLALLILCPALYAQPADARRPMTTDDALNLVQLSDAWLSPDGQTVLYQTSELDWEKNKRTTTVYRIPADGGEPYQYIGEEGGTDFQFSPDGTYLAFKRTVGEDEKDKKAQLFLMRTAGGEAVQLTKHKTGIQSFKWGPEERRLFFTADEPRSEEEEKEFKNGADAIFVDEGPNGQTMDRWQNFWVFDLETEKATRLTQEDMIVGSFDVAPDGQRLVYTARYENRRNQGYLSELYVLNLADSSRVRLTDNEAPESRPLWAPDGTAFVYQAADDEAWDLRNDKLWLMNPETKEARVISEAFEGNIRDAYWTPDAAALLFNGLQRTRNNLYRLTVATGDVEPLTDRDGTLQARAFSKDRSKIVYSYDDLTTPEDLFAAEVGPGPGPATDDAPVRLTTLNPGLADSLLLGTPEVVTWKSKDSLEVEGLLMLPPGYEDGESVPFLLHIHGGPAGVFTNGFHPQYQVWAGLGYAQLMPNVRGSSGYSDDLLRGNMNDIGGGDYEDLMSGVDYVIERGVADPDRLGLRGWSYGGILGGWTITQTDRFKAASIGAGVYDWTSEYGPGFNHDVRLWYIGGTPWENPEAWRAKSALTHVADVTTPTLLLHGMTDPVDTEPQSMMFFTALKDQGKPVRYIRFPREKHGFTEPRHQRTRDIEEIRWMQKYVLGQDWQPWKRPEPDPEEEPTPTKPDATTSRSQP